MRDSTFRPLLPLALVAALFSITSAERLQPGGTAGRLWHDVTADAIGKTALWTNKVEIADLDGDGRPDLLFANGGDYSTPGTPEPSQVFRNIGPGFRFTEITADVFGTMPNLARVIKARDLNGDGLTDIVIGTTYQTQSRLFLGTGGGRFTEVTATHLPAMPLSVGDIEAGDVDGDGDLDLVQAMRRQQPVQKRRQRILHGRSARPAAVHEQLRARADGPRWRWFSRPGHNQ